jgi:hypothetical protein
LELDALLRSHEFMRVERPPHLWEADAELEPVIRMLGELLAYAMRMGPGELSQLTLNASNVSVVEDAPEGVALGDYVALTVRGPGDEWADRRWVPGDAATTFDRFGDLARALDGAGARFAYTRDLAEGGSITAFLPRLA